MFGKRFKGFAGHRNNEEIKLCELVQKSFLGAGHILPNSIRELQYLILSGKDVNRILNQRTSPSRLKCKTLLHISF